MKFYSCENQWVWHVLFTLNFLLYASVGTVGWYNSRLFLETVFDMQSRFFCYFFNTFHVVIGHGQM